MDDVAAAREFDRVSSGSTAGIEDLRSGRNVETYEPGGYYRALFPDGPGR